MTDQLDIPIPLFHDATRLNVQEGFAFYFRHHLGHLPSGATFKSNASYWCRTTGRTYLNDLLDTHVTRHMGVRKAAGASDGTIRHDIKLLSMMLNWVASQKQRRAVLDGFPFGPVPLPFYSPVKGVRRPPKPAPRQVTATPDDFAQFIQHAHEDLVERLFFLIDLAISPADAMRLEPKDFDHAAKAFRFVRRKTRHVSGKMVVLPVSDRCLKIVHKAIREKRKYILKWKECEWSHRQQVNSARWASKIYLQVGRDLRKTNVNKTIREAKGDIRPAQKIAGHASPQTTWDYYYIEDGMDLLPYIKTIEKSFAPRHKVLVNLPKERFFQN
jgi:integrase